MVSSYHCCLPFDRDSSERIGLQTGPQSGTRSSSIGNASGSCNDSSILARKNLVSPILYRSFISIHAPTIEILPTAQPLPPGSQESASPASGPDSLAHPLILYGRTRWNLQDVIITSPPSAWRTIPAGSALCRAGGDKDGGIRLRRIVHPRPVEGHRYTVIESDCATQKGGRRRSPASPRRQIKISPGVAERI